MNIRNININETNRRIKQNMTTKTPQWLKDFNEALRQIVPDYDRRQKILKLFNIVLKEKKKQWEKKYSKIEQKSLL